MKRPEVSVKATVFIDPESQEPRKLEDKEVSSIEEGVAALAGEVEVEWDDFMPPVADYYVVSELSLRNAVQALWKINLTSRCHNSRVLASEALKKVGETGDLPTDEKGMPEREAGNLVFHEMENHYTWGDDGGA
jgi:hypothetical protein